MLNEQTVIGVMSGTSLDGLDLCCARFSFNENEDYYYAILATETIPYPTNILEDLKRAFHLNPEELKGIHKSYGEYIGKCVLDFIEKYRLKGKVDLIGSHGHTIFHQPDKGITLQIGDGQEIANVTRIPTVNDFRSKDVALGGQGAPLVPIGDKLLFAEYESCLNLGGIANISFDYKGERIAFDICPANLPINKLMQDYHLTKTVKLPGQVR